ncbi:MAG: NAD(P)-dependent glycerol-3-phosphate dehydrogenase [Phycisphaerales bacterium]|nr:NAD(P)-dependent glycerol-3-phosphate dehydrogenase [Phycisphaerales bacterium]
MADCITVLGCGQMGLVMADAAVGAGAGSVRILGLPGAMTDQLRRQRENPDRLPGFRLDESVEVFDDPAGALSGADLVVHAIPVQTSALAWSSLASSLEPGAIVVSTAKGMEVDSGRLPCAILSDAIKAAPVGGVCVAALSGPTIATELMHRKPAVMVAAASDTSAVERIQAALQAPWLRIYGSSDLIGVEVAGATKNVIAIAAGICDGLGLGDNTKSAVLARGLAEITRLGEAMGARPETFFGIAGVGDLATTCFSPHGRNRTFGAALGSGESREAFLDRTRATVEGIATTKSLVTLARSLEVQMPITHAVHDVLFGGVSVEAALDALMQREAGAEW